MCSTGGICPCQGVRTRIADDRLFLTYVLCHYLDTSEDWSILQEQVPYLKEREIPPGKRDLYDAMEPGDLAESLYAHCRRAWIAA